VKERREEKRREEKRREEKRREEKRREEKRREEKRREDGNAVCGFSANKAFDYRKGKVEANANESCLFTTLKEFVIYQITFRVLEGLI
jgi:hypothetical protein